MVHICGVRLGAGYYSNQNIEASKAQSHFLEAVERVAPEVLENLRDRVMPVPPGRWPPILEGTSPEQRGVLESWANRHNLSYEWVLRTAVVTLNYWQRESENDREEEDDPEVVAAFKAAADVARKAGIAREERKPRTPPRRRILRWVTLGTCWESPLTDEERVLKLEVVSPGPDDGPEEWLRFERFVVNQVRGHRSRLQELLRQRGWKRTTVKRNRRGSPLVHFEWTARHVVLGHREEDIAEEISQSDSEGIDVDTIRKAVAETSRTLGLKPLTK